jgi:WD repeat-containing protein 48
MGVEGANDEVKLNLGVQTVHALLRDWVKARRAKINDGDDAAAAATAAAADADDEEAADVNGLGPCEDAGVFSAPERRPLLLCEAPGGAATVLMRSAGMEGTDAELAALPEWIVEVANGTYKVPDSPKTSFFLNPGEGQPSLSQGKVTAPRVLGIRKVGG